MSSLAKRAPAKLALEDGTVYTGESFGANGEVDGEVVFNTSMTGYQEILTDPSYRGQIVTMTYPEQGNYGVNTTDVESSKPHLAGFIVREASRIASNFRAQGTLQDYLAQHGIVGLAGIDTRALVRRIRIKGALKGVISNTDLDDARLVAKAQASPGLVGRDLVREVLPDQPRDWQQGLDEWSRIQNLTEAPPLPAADKHIVALDYGMKWNIARHLRSQGFRVTILPGTATAAEVLALQPAGVFLSNGPGDPEPLDYAIRALQWLYWSKTQDNPHLAHLDQHFMEAVEAVLTFFDAGSNLAAPDAADRVRQHLAYWRRDLDAAVHPLAQLGRVLRGDPGAHLEYPGPVFLLTFAEVLEGITHEFVVPEWDLNDARSAHTLIALAAIVLSEIAITCYWVLRANGTHLHTELGRLFGPANRAALVGQLGNLVLAGQVCGWDCQVDFIPEGDAQTPEWSVTRGARRVLVECTSFERLAEQVNDLPSVRTAITTAWNAKRVKFSGGDPGIISTDISGLFVSREFGTLLSADLWERLDATTPIGHPRHLGVYHLA